MNKSCALRPAIATALARLRRRSSQAALDFVELHSQTRSKQVHFKLDNRSLFARPIPSASSIEQASGRLVKISYRSSLSLSFCLSWLLQNPNHRLPYKLFCASRAKLRASNDRFELRVGLVHTLSGLRPMPFAMLSLGSISDNNRQLQAIRSVSRVN